MFSTSRPASILGTHIKYTKLQSNSIAMNKANQREKEKEKNSELTAKESSKPFPLFLNDPSGGQSIGGQEMVCSCNYNQAGSKHQVATERLPDLPGKVGSANSFAGKSPA